MCLTFLTANELLMKRSSAIELTVYEANGGTTSPAYRTKMRSLYLNLKGKENPSLREGVVSGDIPVAKLCTMSSQVGVDSGGRGPYHLQYLSLLQDMASEERKQKDQQIQDKNLFAVLGAGEQQAETDAFKCGRCKQVSILLMWSFGKLKVPRSVKLYTDKRKPALPMNR
jgi:transcription elongation factor S-II